MPIDKLICPYTKDTYRFPGMELVEACWSSHNEMVFMEFCDGNYNNCEIYQRREIEEKMFKEEMESN